MSPKKYQAAGITGPALSVHRSAVLQFPTTRKKSLKERIGQRE